MIRRLVPLAVVAAAVGGVAAGDSKPADPAARVVGKWVLPGGGDAWEFHADGTVTGTVLGGIPTFLADRTAKTGNWLTYTVGKYDADKRELAAEFKVRSVAADGTAADGTFRATLAFTRKGRMTVRYTAKPPNADRLALPFPEDKKLYRPDDLDD
ncbi:MAG: hypothetical protein K2X82_19905 [Gemmataceae bacterium]|nr:hypothetical protein [Gemmataceae bacterium]